MSDQALQSRNESSAERPVETVVQAVVYHGTSQPFERFGHNPAGLFFAEDLMKATSYASIRLGPTPRVIRAELTINRPWTLIRYGLDVPYRDQLDQSVPTLAAQGFDGIHIPEEGVWVAFSPDQVRVLGDSPVDPVRRGGIPAVRFSLADGRAQQPGTGDPSRPYDFAHDERFAHLFYGDPSPAEVKAFSSWLRSRPNEFVRLYHGTAAANPIWEEGLLPTSLTRRNSIQSGSGFVYLSVFPGMAFDFGRYASLNRPADADGARVAVYPVTMTIRSLAADIDQLHNRRLWAGEVVGNSLAESLVRARGARHRGRIGQGCLGQPQRFMDRDTPVAVPEIRQEAPAGVTAGVDASTVRFSFGGRRARTADLAQLERAKLMAALGSGSAATHQKTGWSIGVDGQWRFEIDDSGARLLPALKSLRYGPVEQREIASISYRVTEAGLYDLCLNPPNPQVVSDFVQLYGLPRRVLRDLVPEAVVMAIDARAGSEDWVHDFEEGRRIEHEFTFEGINALPLEEVLHHPALYEAYPGLKHIPVRVDPRLGVGGSLGELANGRPLITIGLGQQLQTLMHEIQHGVQSVEGFALGGSITGIAEKQSVAIPFSYLNPALAIRKMAAEHGVTVKDFRALAPRHLRDAPDEAWVLAAARTLENLEQEFAFSEIAYEPTKSYVRLAGEVEARNVMTRLEWGAAQRKLVPPAMSADVKPEEQLILMAGELSIRRSVRNRA